MTQTQIRVSLVVEGYSCPSSQITNAIGVEPTETRRAGDLIREPEIRKATNGWLLAENHDDASDLGESLRSLLRRIPLSADLGLGRDSRTATILCGISIVQNTPTMTLDQELLTRICALGADLEIDIVLA